MKQADDEQQRANDEAIALVHDLTDLLNETKDYSDALAVTTQRFAAIADMLNALRRSL